MEYSTTESLNDARLNTRRIKDWKEKLTTVLFIVPAFASHYNPIVPLATSFKVRGDSVVIATGRHLSASVSGDGFGFCRLELEASGNDGLVDPTMYDPRQLSLFLSKSKEGMCSVLALQAQDRLDHLLWQTSGVKVRIKEILQTVHPDITIVVHLAYNATISLIALGAPFVTFVTGHPFELPLESECMGYPSDYPNCFNASVKELSALHTTCFDAQSTFTKSCNEFLRNCNVNGHYLKNGYSVCSDLLIVFSYPLPLLEKPRYHFPADSVFMSRSVRDDELDKDIAEFIKSEQPNWPLAYVSLGSFFSLRSDLLLTIMNGLRLLPIRVVLSSGVVPVSTFMPIEPHWFVRDRIPQVALIPECDLVICHAGANTIKEALLAGKPLLVGPLSSDQFFTAADIERMGVGICFNPSEITSIAFSSLVDKALACSNSALEMKEKIEKGMLLSDVTEIIRLAFNRIHRKLR